MLPMYLSLLLLSPFSILQITAATNTGFENYTTYLFLVYIDRNRAVHQTTLGRTASDVVERFNHSITIVDTCNRDLNRSGPEQHDAQLNQSQSDLNRNPIVSWSGP